MSELLIATKPLTFAGLSIIWGLFILLEAKHPTNRWRLAFYVFVFTSNFTRLLLS